MRDRFSVIFAVMIIALAVCSVIAFRSRKMNSFSVALLTGAFIPPVIGNLILVRSGDKAVSQLGEYIYFIGMDIVMFALMRFTLEYCNIRFRRKSIKLIVYLLLTADIVQLLLNPITGHAFDNEAIEVDGFLSPGAFIPVFEKNGMIVEVDKYMWRCACEILASWKKKGLGIVHIR